MDSFYFSFTIVAFPYSSFGKESACRAGYLSSIPGSGRSSGEGNSNPDVKLSLSNVLELQSIAPGFVRPEVCSVLETPSNKNN